MASAAVEYLKSTATSGLAAEAGMAPCPSLGSYRVADSDLATGSTLGSPRVCCVLKATGAIEKVFSVDAGATLVSTFLIQHWETRSGARLTRLPGTFGIHPEYQDHKYLLSNGIDVSEATFALSRGRDDDAAVVYVLVSYRNTLSQPVEMSTYAFCDLAGERECDLSVRYEKRHRGIVAWNAQRPAWARFVGCSNTPDEWEATHDQAKAVHNRAPGPLSCSADAKGAPLGVFRLDHRIEPDQSVRFWFVLAVGADGSDALLADAAAAPQGPRALEETRAHYHDVLSRGVVATPNAQVNLGVLWAKANMLRVELRPKSGWCLTNSPTMSTSVVGRDTAWFTMGADYITPQFARGALEAFIDRQAPDGKIIEYYDMLDGRQDDYGLNVNDNTPLIVISCAHHAAATADREFLARVYPAALRAVRQFLAHRDERGLVHCTATGTSSWGIVGWRNIIPNYRISGSSTELNAECYAALRAVAKMGNALGDLENAARMEREAEALRKAIVAHLSNPDNGLFLLTIDVDGTLRTEVSSDLVFPVIFDVADEAAAQRITQRLSADDFWTDAGVRTVPHNAPSYSPNRGSGLLGGVWVGVSFWYAWCAARFLPEKMEQALANGFANYSRDPRRSNTVPGQFSEWLDGETLVNSGMMLSPWFPPRYLWTAIEGVAGYTPEFDGPPSLQPRVPTHWTWIAARNIAHGERLLTWFLVRGGDGRLFGYANGAFRTELQMTQLAEDVSARLELTGDDTVGIALREGNKVIIFVGTSAEHSTTCRLHARQIHVSRVRAFDGLNRTWSPQRTIESSELDDGYLVPLGPRGCHILEFET